MLNKIIHFSLNNRILILVASVLLMVGGAYTSFHTEVDVFPDLNAPTVVVMTEANGMAAEEVEQLVTFPVETAVNGATNVRRVRSSSTNGFSVVWVEFDWGTDIYLARQIVSEKLAIVSEELPDNVGNPTLGPQSSILGELMIIGLTADSTSMLDLRTLADWTIRPRLLSMGGVAQVAVLGGDIKEYQIRLDPARMKHYGVTLPEVMAATRDMNQNANGGVIYEYGNEYIVRGALSSTDVDELSRAVVKRVGDMPVTLGDVAHVGVGAQQPKLGCASVEGKPAVLITVTKQPNTGTLNLTEKIDASLADLQKNLPADVKVSTDIFRQSHFIESSIGNVRRSLYEGAIFVVVILFLFLANVRTTLISLVTLPLSLVVSVLVLHWMGMTINTMSLGGMAIAIGSLVDDAIVDVENVWKRLRENKMKPLAERQSVMDVVFRCLRRRIRMPILNSTLIIIVSFVPLFFLSGMEGRMLVPLGIAFIVALVASTVVALTLTPVLCSYLLGREKGEGLPKESFVSVWLRKYYAVALEWALRHSKAVLGTTIAVFLVALGFFFYLGAQLPAILQRRLVHDQCQLAAGHIARRNTGRSGSRPAACRALAASTLFFAVSVVLLTALRPLVKKYPVIRPGAARFPRRFAPRNDKFGGIVRSAMSPYRISKPARRSGSAAVCQKSPFGLFRQAAFRIAKSNFVVMILQFCRCGGLLNAKGHPDGFLVL